MHDNLIQQALQYLPHQLAELVARVERQANCLGQKAYLVGGIIRDMLLDCPNCDLDIVVEGDAMLLAREITKTTEAKTLASHSRFGTAKLGYKSFIIDLSTARRESYPERGALPAVAPGTIEEDLARRDFTINSMAICLSPCHYGELLDPFDGKEDLEQKLIRILHPRSFQDDATRILRAIRYEQRLDFRLEKETSRLLKQDIPMLDTISGDRIRHELELIFREKYPEKILNRLDKLNILQYLSPHLKAGKRLASNFNEARLLVSASQLPSLYLCLFIYPLEEESVKQFTHRFKIPAKQTRLLIDTVRIKKQIALLSNPCIKNSEVYFLLCNYTLLSIQANSIASTSERARGALELYLRKLRHIKPVLTGETLQKLGIPIGPEIGKTLQFLLKEKLDDKAKTRKQEEQLVLSTAKPYRKEGNDLHPPVA